VVFGYSSPDVSAAGYACTLDGRPVTGGCPGNDRNGGSVPLAGLADGQHTFTVAAFASGGLADPSPASRTWTVNHDLDPTAPDTRIDAGPADGSRSGTSVIFRYSSPDVSAVGYDCTLDRRPVACPGSDQSGDSKLLTALDDGSHTFTVAAFDSAGLLDASPATRTWTVDSGLDPTAPNTRIDSGPATGEVTGSSVVFFYSSPDASAAGYACRLDGASVACAGKDPSGGSTALTGLSDGPHTFTVAAFDDGGLLDASPATRTWRVNHDLDRTAPDTRIDAGPGNGDTTGTSVVFGYSSPDASAAGFQCTLDGRPLTTGCPGSDQLGGSVAVSGLSDGPHTLAVAAFDADGLVDATPATRTWTVNHDLDPTAPDTRIDSGPVEDATTGTSVVFGYSSPDASAAGYVCTLDGAPLAVGCPGGDPSGWQCVVGWSAGRAAHVHGGGVRRRWSGRRDPRGPVLDGGPQPGSQGPGDPDRCRSGRRGHHGHQCGVRLLLARCVGGGLCVHAGRAAVADGLSGQRPGWWQCAVDWSAGRAAHVHGGGVRRRWPDRRDPGGPVLDGRWHLACGGAWAEVAAPAVHDDQGAGQEGEDRGDRGGGGDREGDGELHREGCRQTAGGRQDRGGQGRDVPREAAVEAQAATGQEGRRPGHLPR
jgi:hypothetical protein